MADRFSVDLATVLGWGPCPDYGEARLRELAGGRERITAREILTLPIPAQDRLWAVLREELVPASILHEFACRCAEGALLRQRERGREPDARSWYAIEVKRAWLRGDASDGDLGAARDAAWDAARDASLVASDASWAAWAASWDARAASWAASLAARAAARDASDAVWDAARDAQVKILDAMLAESVSANGGE